MKKFDKIENQTCRDPLEDSDSEDMGVNNIARLSWRQDPSVNLSDWRIMIVAMRSDIEINDSQSKKDGTRIVSETDSEIDEVVDEFLCDRPVYHVHRSILAASSEYFYSLFHTNLDTKEMANQESVIHLEQSACRYFPIMLDYMYNPMCFSIEKNTSSLFQTENASALRYLANYFRVRELYYMASKFIRQDIDKGKILEYLEGASLFSDSTLYEMVVKYCSKNLESIDEELLVQIPFETFEQIVESFLVKYRDPSDDRQFSMKIASYLEVVPSFSSSATFRSLVREEGEGIGGTRSIEISEAEIRPHMRLIHPKAALRFLQMDHLMVYPWFKQNCAHICTSYWQRISLWDESCKLPVDLSDIVYKNALYRAKNEIEALRWFVFDLLRSSFDEMDRKNENFFRSFIYTSRLMRRMTGEMEAFRNEEFVARKRHSAPRRLEVKSAGIELVNGMSYELIGCRNGYCVYSNGDFVISRFSREQATPTKWYISWPSPEGNALHDLIFYECDSNSVSVPMGGWINFKIRRHWAEPPPTINRTLEPSTRDLNLN